MAKVKIVFTDRRGFSLFSWLIKKVLGSKYSHVMLQLELTKLERSLAFQASAFGVEALNSAEYTKKYKVIHSKELEMSREGGMELRRFCIDNLDKSYGWKTILGIAYRYVLGKFTKYGKDGTETFICSEFVAKALKHGIPDLKDKFGKDVDSMDPKQLYELIRSI